MHCEIVDRYFNILFVEMQLKKENLKKKFWEWPNWFTGLPNGLNIHRHIKFFSLENSFSLLPLFLLGGQCSVLKFEKEESEKSEWLEGLKDLLPGLWFARGSTQADTM